MRHGPWLFVSGTLLVCALLADPRALAQRAPESSAASCSVDPVSAGPACVPDNTLADVTRCPDAVRPLPAPTAPPAPPVPTAPTPAAPPTARHGEGTVTDAMLPDRERARAASEQLLEREVQLTRQLYSTLPADSINRPAAIARMVVLLEDLAHFAVDNARALDEPLHAARERADAPEVARLERAQQEQERRAAAARNDVARTLEPYLHDPRQNPPHADELFYALASAYAGLHRADDARRTYAELLQRFPLSRYAFVAYAAIGDDLFDRGQLAEARAFYEHVTAAPSPDNRLYAYALYKLAWVAYNQSDYEAALRSFFGVIEYARQHPDEPAAVGVVPAARGELVLAYGALYGAARPLDPSHAFQTFARYAQDDEQALAMLERLAELYRDNGQWAAAVASYHELAARRPRSDALCGWQAGVARAALASGSVEAQRAEIARLLDVYDAFRDPAAHRSTEARARCRDESARIAFDAASHWHASVVSPVGSAPAPAGPDRAAALSRALELYNALLQRFPDLDEVTYPALDRRDWPTRYRVAYYRALLLRERGEQCECGPAFDGVVEIDPAGALSEDSAYRAVLCYNDCFTARRETRPDLPHATDAASGEHLPPRDLSAEESGMVRAFTRYVCAASVSHSASVSPQDLLLIRYRRAWVYYRANHFEEAAALFRDVALSDPSVPDPEGARLTAADLYLDALNVMAYRWDPPRAACGQGLAEAVAALRSRFCSSSAATTPGGMAEFCERTEVVTCGVRRHRAEGLHGRACHAEAAHTYLSLVREGLRCDDLDEILYDGAVEYDEARMLGRAMRVREALVAQFLARNSRWAQAALYRLAGNYQAVQIYSRAAELYEQYARFVHEHRAQAERAESEARAQAADALRRATAFRIGLGEEDQALANAATFGRFFGADPARRRQAAAVEFAVGQIYQDRARRLSSAQGGSEQERERRQADARAAWGAVVSHYGDYLAHYARNGTLDERVEGEVAVARGYWNLDDTAHALAHYRAASDAWGRAARGADGRAQGAEPGEARVRQELGGGADADAAVSASREAVAEARFYLAEGTYQRFTGRRLPAFRGRGAAAFRAWEEHTLRPFVTRQFEDLQTVAAPAYVELLAMGVPSWQIAAAERLADMYYQFGTYVRDASEPPDVLADDTLHAEYLALRDRHAARFLTEAQRGFELCLTTAARAQWFNEWSQLCERRLNAMDARRYPLADEVHIEPGLVYSRPANSQPVYSVGADAEGEL